MKKFVRFAGVALLALTIGVVGCDDDAAPVAPVAPPTPPPPPLEVTMSPASQTIGVGGTVVFAVSVSGGVAGATASWTCASSDTSKATVTIDPAGCAVTAVAAGGVSITAAVTKGAETVNAGAGLTILEDMAERASLFIASIKDSDGDDEVLSGRVNVTLSVELGDQMLTKLSVLVDGVVVDTMAFGGASVVAAVVAAAPEGEEGERAAQQAVHPFDLSFNSAHYDTLTGVPTYMNGERTISAKLMVASSDEPIESGFHVREFGNGDGVHLDVAVPSNDALDNDGNVWYGGPGTTLKIKAVPVLYSGGSASAVTLFGFCGANAETVDATPFEFTPDCEGKGKTTVRDENGVGDTPMFTLTVGGEAIAVGADDIKNSDDDIFPINLDYEGPGAPTFKPNPNKREGGWVNTAVAFMSTDPKDKNRWLTKGTSDAGVGGYTPQLRFAPVPKNDPDDGLTEALEATAYRTVPPGAVLDSKVNAYCVVASAVDKLGNESARPDDEKGSCKVAGTATQYDDMEMLVEGGEATGYTALVETLAAAKTIDDKDAIKNAEDALKDAGLRAGVDLTPPAAVFTGGSLDKDATALEDDPMGDGAVTQYRLHLTDNRGLRAAEPVVDTLVIRDADGVRDGLMTTLAMPEGDLSQDQPLADVQFGEDGTGYYTYTAQAQDMAGNLSEAATRVAVHDVDEPVSALIFAKGKDAFNYDKTLVMADNLSIQEYSVVIGGGAGLPTDVDVRLKRADIDAYNSQLTQSETVSDSVKIPFIAVKTAAGNVVQGDVITSFTAYVTDQAGNAALDEEPVTITVDANSEGAGDVNADEGIIDGVGTGYVFKVEDDDGAITAGPTGNNVARSDETIELTVTATVAQGTVPNPFADGVFFFAQVTVDYFAMNVAATRDELRLIGMVAGLNAELDTSGLEREWTYATEVGADDYYAIVGKAGMNTIHALGVNGDGVALRMSFDTPLDIAKR